MRSDAEAQAWAEKVVDGLLERKDVPDAWHARSTLLRLLTNIASDIAETHRRAVVDLDAMIRAFYEAGGLDGLTKIIVSSKRTVGDSR